MLYMGKLITVITLLFLVGCGTVPESESPPANSSSSNEQETTQTVKNPMTKTKNSDFNQSDSAYKDAFKEEKPGIVPAKLIIDSLGVNDPVEKVGQNKKGGMGVPENVQNAGWYKFGAKPGEQGSAVVAGHVNTRNGKSIFWNLHKLETGDEVEVLNKSGEKRTFKVIGKESYDYQHAPVKKIFGYTSRRKLNLITCTGDFNYDAGTHQERLVIYTELKDE